MLNFNEIGSTFDNVSSAIDQAKLLIKDERYENAIELLKTEIKKVKKAKVNGSEEYYTFDEMFQFDMFIRFYAMGDKNNKKQKKHARIQPNVVWLTHPVADLYYYCGYALVEIGDAAQAMNTLRMGLEWNPCSLDLRIEMLNILKNQGDMDKVHSALREMYKFIYTPQRLSRFYRDKGYAYIEEKKWEAAITSYFLSMAFTDDEDDIEKARGELGYIEENMGREVVEPSTEELLRIAHEFKIPVGIDERLLKLAEERFKQSIANNDSKSADYYRGIYENKEATIVNGEKLESTDLIKEAQIELDTQNYAKALDLYHQAAMQGDSEAMHALGMMYCRGEGVQKDNREAIYWFEKAAEKGNTVAMCNLGYSYEFGEGVERDFAKSIKYYQDAIDAGDGNALYRLGNFYYCEQDYDKALSLLERAVVEATELKNDAEELLGSMYRDGKGVERNYVKAAEWFAKAIEHENIMALVALGMMYKHGLGVEQDEAKALQMILQAANLGQSIAMYNMGSFYEEGTCIIQDYTAARAWYQKAAEAGDGDAMCSMGDLYYWGNGVEEDKDIAQEWYEKAAETDCEDAIVMLGLICYYRQDYENALSLLKRGAVDTNSRQALAEDILGEMYRDGNGVDKNAMQAIAFFEKAVEHGVDVSLISLGDMYANGNGVEKDLSKARSYYEKAKAAGVDVAEQRMTDLG